VVGVSVGVTLGENGTKPAGRHYSNDVVGVSVNVTQGRERNKIVTFGTHAARVRQQEGL